MNNKKGEVSEESTHCNPLETVVSSKGSNNQPCMEIVPYVDVNVDTSDEFTTDEVFKSREAIVKWARDVGKRNKFLVIIKTSDAGTQTKKPRLTFGCERGGKFVPMKKVKEVSKDKRRKTGTKKCGCPFELKGKKLDSGDDWKLFVVCGVHNHPMLEYEEGHSFAGRLNREESELVYNLSKSMVQPKVIFNELKKSQPSNVSNIKVIYNIRQKLKVIEKAGRSNMQLLMSKIVAHKYLEFKRSCDETNSVRDLFFAHPFGVELLRTFPRVLFMDCTYKTNRFNFPLFEIVGVTSTMKTFSIAFALIENEKEDNYTWALEKLKSLMAGGELPQVILTDRELALMNAIAKVFPDAKHMLCTWHIEKNIATNCKKVLGDKKMWDKFNTVWNMIVISSTKEDYHHNVASLKKDFGRFPDAVSYVTENWLNPYKERFVAAWTDSYMHYGNTTTNRVESQHSKLKRQLQNSQHNYEMVWTAINDSLLSQHTEIRESFEKSKMVQPHLYRPIYLFDHLRGVVSISALDLINHEVKNLDSMGKNAEICGCELRLTHGLPCAHEIAQYDREACAIPIQSIDKHWRRLSIVPLENEPKTSGCEDELELLQNQYNSLTGSAKLHFKQKMRELGEPFRTLLSEPQVKKNTRGRPKGKKGKIDKSTKRDPSAFEYVHFDTPNLEPIVLANLETKKNNKKSTMHVSSGCEFVQFDPSGIEENLIAKPERKKKRKNSTSPYEYVEFDPSILEPERKKNKKELPPPKVHGTRGSMTHVEKNSESFKSSFPLALRQYISHIINVQGDGNCGFRVVAALVGYGHHAWKRVRKELLEELHKHDNHYMNVFYGGEFSQFERALQWWDEAECAPRENWMDMPMMGYLIASRYNIVVYFFSMLLCCTILPLRTQPTPIESRTEIGIGHVNGNHFVQVFMKPDHPVPPIISRWETMTNGKISAGWATPYAERIEQWKNDVNPLLNCNDSIDMTVEEEKQISSPSY